MTDKDKKINSINHYSSADFAGKRLLALDYGRKRVGTAVCDELHITVSAREVLLRDNIRFMDMVRLLAERERVAAVIVGVPYRNDEEITPLIVEIQEFIEKISLLINLPVIPFDEAFSSRRAMQAMIAVGIKKQSRAKKGATDSAAATVILRDFLQNI
ncbi:Holliday junction resolvase RuvX [Ignavibacteria bacterium]|jgi:putative Holliday junction resolvase|nr:Holliday junction resolvase RuvX [Bacteroidota bacterium]MCZ2133688.1 Holliday junction resolvase RuvX [Bacteroidota bacterium]